jgi:hypothetical protein
MGLTTDRKDPDLGYGVDDQSVPQNKKYLVLSDEELAKGYVKPYRTAYKHVGRRPRYPLRDLTDEEKEHYGDQGYVSFEVYPEGHSSVGRFWTQKELDSGCGGVTTMGHELSATYARDPWFYGATYCCYCRKHRPLDEFIWEPDGETMDVHQWPAEEIARIIELRKSREQK